MPGPRDRYQQQIDAGTWIADPAQQAVVEHFQRRYESLLAECGMRWLPWRPRTPVKGIYLVGSVGRGKTLLMDLFSESLNDQSISVWRIHFHRFMAHVHAQLGQIKQQSDPLKSVAQTLARKVRVLCFDEFHVDDIGDAMILGELFGHLFNEGVMLVATSNTAPDQLYWDGLQRARFLPAIEEIKNHCEIVSLEARQDYRLRQLTQAPTYFSPCSQESHACLEERFQTLSGTHAQPGTYELAGREIEVMGHGNGVFWASFDALFKTARSSKDYIQLVSTFQTLIISGVPVLGVDDSDAAKRFIHFVDEAYDQRAKLIVEAKALPDALYRGKRLKTAFERTCSRLIEMQSTDYLEASRDLPN